MATRTRIDPDRLYRAVESVSFVDEGVPVALTRETVLLGRHEHVQRFPQFFGIEGDPADLDAVRAALNDPAEERALHALSRQSGVVVMETRYKATRNVRVD